MTDVWWLPTTDDLLMTGTLYDLWTITGPSLLLLPPLIGAPLSTTEDLRLLQRLQHRAQPDLRTHPGLSS